MNEKTLYDLCTKGECKRDEHTGCIPVMAFRKRQDTFPQRKAYMEKRLRNAKEYVLLRGQGGTEPLGILSQVEAIPVRKINEEAILRLCLSVPCDRWHNAVFVMNASTMYTLHAELTGSPLNLLTSNWKGFALLGRPVMLIGDMPCLGAGNIPILFGDFSHVVIEDCGHDSIREQPHGNRSSEVVCTMNGYMNCTLNDREAVKDLKLV